MRCLNSKIELNFTHAQLVFNFFIFEISQTDTSFDRLRICISHLACVHGIWLCFECKEWKSEQQPRDLVCSVNTINPKRFNWLWAIFENCRSFFLFLFVTTTKEKNIKLMTDNDDVSPSSVKWIKRKNPYIRYDFHPLFFCLFSFTILSIFRFNIERYTINNCLISWNYTANLFDCLEEAKWMAGKLGRGDNVEHINNL